MILLLFVLLLLLLFCLYPLFLHFILLLPLLLILLLLYHLLHLLLLQLLYLLHFLLLLPLSHLLLIIALQHPEVQSATDADADAAQRRLKPSLGHNLNAALAAVCLPFWPQTDRERCLEWEPVEQLLRRATQQLERAN